MINPESNPVEWALMMMDLDETREHLNTLIQEMSECGYIDEESFAVDLGHIYAHLNRIWFSRKGAKVDESNWDKASMYPTDLKVVG